MPGPLFKDELKISTINDKIMTSSTKSDNLPAVVIPPLAVNIRDYKDVLNFAGQNANELGSFVNDILSHVRVNDVGDSGSRLVSIVTKARGLNISALNQNNSKIPFIGKFIDGIKAKREAVISQFNTLSDEIDTVVKELTTVEGSLTNRITQLEQFYSLNRQRINELDNQLTIGSLIATTERHNYAVCADEAAKSSDPLKKQEAIDWEKAILRFEKRLADLHIIRSAAVQALPMIRLIQNNNAAFIEKFQTSIQMTIPEWKKQFVIATALQEQRKAAELSQTIDDTTNELYLRNFQMLNETSVAAAKASNRQVIDIETLQQANELLISTFTEIKKIDDEGTKARQELPQQLETLNKQMYSALTNLKA